MHGSFAPFFFNGGRYTIEDVHYVANSDRLVPAGDTKFAKDASFGYKSSNLCEWVEEKTAGCILASSVTSISIQLLRTAGPDVVRERLCSLQKDFIGDGIWISGYQLQLYVLVCSKIDAKVDVDQLSLNY